MRLTLMACLGLAWMFVVTALPAVGVVLAYSTVWNVVWWVAYIAWGLFLSSRDSVGFYFVAALAVQIPLLVLLESGLGDLLVLRYLWAFWSVIIYSGMVRRVAENLAERDNGGLPNP